MMLVRKVLVTGAGGMLGRAVVAAFSEAGWEVAAAARQELDVTDFAAVRNAVCGLHPAVVVNCAAYTAVDRAELEPDKAVAANALGARNLALACLEAGAELVHISTDYVFSGSKGRPYGVWDPCDPVNAYGRSKALGEELVRLALPRHYVVRTAWLFGHGRRNFVSAVLEAARSSGVVQVVDCEWGCPTFAEDLARALVGLVKCGVHGTYHVTNSGSATRLELAREAVRLAGVPARVEPAPAGLFRRLASRPPEVLLDPFPLQEVVGCLLPDWRDALARYIGGCSA